MISDNATGHVRGLVMGFERMLASGEELKRIREIKFRKSIETSYQNPEKRRTLCPMVKDRPGAVQHRHRGRASLVTECARTEAIVILTFNIECG